MLMTMDEAVRLFGNLGVHLRTMGKLEFTHAYYALARRYHPDRNNGKTAELMANINAARTSVLKFHHWEDVDDEPAKEPAHAAAAEQPRGFGRKQAP
ncbi:MAG TPA: J domain-containing protein [Stellaceae bacterium]|nr:J domain-containing protein [Stellaceae bacterium]